MSPSDRHRAEVYARYGLTCPPRWATLRNFDNPTYGGKAAKVAAALGTPFNPWQRYTVDTGLEVDRRTGLFVYRKLGVRVPRQSGKTTGILSISVQRAMAWQRQRILYAAQSGTAAREKWEDEHVDSLVSDASPFRNRIKIRRANGREAIIWKATRSIHGITTNTEKAGHGKVLHLGNADEYFAQVDYRIESAWGPAMVTIPMAQLWWWSTAGTARSVPLNEETEAGRLIVESGEPSTTAYFDWCAEEGADYTDPRVWLSCMPSLCPADVDGVCRCSPSWRHTVTMATMRAELESAQKSPLKMAEFLRAYMNWTREDTDLEADPNVPPVEAWNLLADREAVAGDVVAFCVDITPMRDRWSISAAAARADGLRHLELVAHGEHIGDILPKIGGLRDRLKPVAWVIDERSAAATLITPMEKKLGIKRMSVQNPERGGLWVMSTVDLGAACASLADGVREATVVHPGEKRVAAAWAGARTRPLGDGAWAFGRKVTDADISPVVSHAGALAGLERYKDLAVDYDALNNIW